MAKSLIHHPAVMHDRLSELTDHAHAVEMALCGSVSMAPEERNALCRVTEMLVSELVILRDEVGAQLDDEGEDKQ